VQSQYLILEFLASFYRQLINVIIDANGLISHWNLKTN